MYDPEAIVAIDPGLTGAIAIQSGSGKVTVADMPTLADRADGKKSVDIHGVINLVPVGSKIFIERQQSMPQQGVASTFQTGINYGRLLGCIGAMAWEHTIIEPKAWSKTVGRPTGAGKDWNVSRARQLFPDLVDVLLKSKDGRADALLMLAHATNMDLAPPAPEPSPEDAVPTTEIEPAGEEFVATRPAPVEIPDW